MHRPLADEIRPCTLDEVVGQRHLIGKGAVLRRLIESGTSANMVLRTFRHRKDNSGQYHCPAYQ